MEAKKNKKVDLETRRALHFTIGLFISMALVTTAFEWRTAFDPVLDLPVTTVDMPKVIDMPQTIQHPPKPKKVIIPEIIKPVDDDIKIDDIVVALPTFDDPVSEADLFTEPTKEIVDELFITAEENPSYPGGLQAFYQYVSKNLDYPQKATRQGIEGKVYVQFVVDKDGSLSSIKVLKGIGGGCDEEAIRVIKNAPHWNPGKQRGRAVRVQMTIPIIFRLQ